MSIKIESPGSSSSSGSPLTVTESDGVPSVPNVTTIKFPNGSLTDDGGGTVTLAFAGSGDVVGPGSSTDNTVVRFDGTTGKLIQDSAVTIADTSGNIVGGTYNGNTIGAGATSGTNTGDQTSVTGNAGTVTVADAGGDTTTWPLLGTSQTGSLAPATDAGLTYNATTNALTATTFVGALTGNADTATNQSGTNTGDQLTFKTIAVSGQSDIVADTATDTLTIVAGTNITLTTNAGTDTLTIAASGGSGDITAVGDVASGAAFDGTAGTTLTGTTAGGLNLKTPDTASGNSGNILIKTGDEATDDSGSISIITGSAGTTQGLFSISAYNASLTSNTVIFKDSGNAYLTASAGNLFINDGANTTLWVNKTLGLMLKNSSGFNLFDVNTSGLSLYNASTFNLFIVSTTSMALYDASSFQRFVADGSGFASYLTGGNNLFRVTDGVIELYEASSQTFGISSGGVIYALSLDTDNAPPTTSGVTRTVITDDAGKLSFTYSPTLFTQTADATVANTTSETSIVGSGVGSLTLPANFFIPGRTIRITMSGVYSTVAVTGDTVTVKIKYGSTVLATKATTALVTGGSNLAWFSDCLVTCRADGGSGSIQVCGGLKYQIAGSAIVADQIIATTTLDTTASGLFDVTVTHSAANAANTVKSVVGSFEVLN